MKGKNHNLLAWSKGYIPEQLIVFGCKILDEQFWKKTDLLKQKQIKIRKY
jgi:hypothetical protein